MKWRIKNCNRKYCIDYPKPFANDIMKFVKINHGKKHYSLLYYIFLIMIIIPLAFNFPYKTKGIAHILNQLNSNQITIKIQGTGKQRILNENYDLCPDIVYLNNGGTNIIESNCSFVNIPANNGEINTLTLIWNTDATSLYGIFEDMKSLLEVDMSSYDTSLVTDMSQMFLGCSSLTSINLSNLKTSSVTSMKLMFSDCSSLNELDVSSFDTSNVVDMKFMFSRLSKLRSLNVSNFNTHKVENMSNLFEGMEQLENLDLTNFDTSNVLYMNSMFYNCKSLVSLDLSNFNTLKVKSMDTMFLGCEKLISLDLSNFKTPNLEIMDEIFYECFSLETLYIPNIDTSKITNMYGLFYYCTNLKSLNISSFNTSNVENMDFMFAGCSSLTSLNLSHFNTEKVNTMYAMLSDCQELQWVDLSSFDVSSVTNFCYMISYCNSLASLDLSNFITSSATDMSYMFAGSSNLTYLNISYFVTTSVKTLEGLFANCSSLTSLDVSGFDTKKVTSFNSMFYNCNQLKEIDLSFFETNSLNDITQMFYGCDNLVYINLQNYNEYKELGKTKIFDLIPENIVVCLNEDNTLSQLKIELNKKKCPTIYCGNDWKSKQKKLVYGNDTCENDCLNYTYENDNICYSDCPDGVDFCTPDITNSELSSIATSETDSSPQQSDTINIMSTDVSFHQSDTKDEIIQNSDSENTGTSDISQGELNAKTSFVTDEATPLLTEREQIDSGSHIESNELDSSSNEIKVSNDLSNNLEDNISDDLTDNIPEKINITDTKDNLLQAYSDSEKVESQIKVSDNTIYEITNSDIEKDYLNEKKNTTKQSSVINLGYCENILKEYYHIESNVSLIIIKYEKLSNSSTERALQYEVYEPVNKTKLNLSLCDNTTISIYTPVVLSDELQQIYNQLKDMGYDLFDINNAFYQDICIPFKSPYGTDVLLSDRIKYYFNNNETMCQSNCKFSNYSMESQYLKCDCDTSNSEIITKEIDKFTPNTVIDSFYDTLKFSNYKVLFCYKLPFSINSVTTNKGSILAIIYFAIYFILLIVFFIKGTAQFKIYLAKEVFNKPLHKNDDDLDNKDGNKNKDIKSRKTVRFDASNNLSKTNKTTSLLNPHKTSKKDIKVFNFPPKKKKSISNKHESIKDKTHSKKSRYSQYKISDNNLLISDKIYSVNKNTDMKFNLKKIEQTDFGILVNIEKRAFNNIYILY